MDPGSILSRMRKASWIENQFPKESDAGRCFCFLARAGGGGGAVSGVFLLPRLPEATPRATWTYGSFTFEGLGPIL